MEERNMMTENPAEENTECPHCKAAESTEAAGQLPSGSAAEEPDSVSGVPDCCRHKDKARAEKEYKDLLNRLNRIEGQVRGVKRMLENNAYCIDIIIQVTAINSALNSFNKVILTNHMQTCVSDDIKNGGEEKLNELLKTLPKLMK